MDSLIQSRILEKLRILEVERGSVLEIEKESALGAKSGEAGVVRRPFDLL